MGLALVTRECQAMVERVSDLVKIDVSGLVFRGRSQGFRCYSSRLNQDGRTRFIRITEPGSLPDTFPLELP